MGEERGSGEEANKKVVHIYPLVRVRSCFNKITEYILTLQRN